MEFKKCQTGTEVYGNLTEQDITNGVTEYQGMVQSSVDFVKAAILEHLKPGQVVGRKQSGPVNPSDGARLYNFFRLLAVCHTVVVDIDPRTGEVTYQASSPDELALIQGAK